jgi:hypothetical protein
MSYADVAAPCGGATQVDCCLLPPPTSLHHVAYLQGCAVLIDLCSVKPDLTKEERNQFSSSILLLTSPWSLLFSWCFLLSFLILVFVAAETCQAALDKLQAGIP